MEVTEQGSGILRVLGSTTVSTVQVDVVSQIGVPDFSIPSVEVIAVTAIESGTGGARVYGSASLGADVGLSGTGGAKITGSAQELTSTPIYYTISGSGGARIYGSATLQIVNPSVYSESSLGGCRVTGQNVLRIEDVIVDSGSGLIKISGPSAVTYFSPTYHTISGSGGLKVLGSALLTTHQAPTFSEIGSGTAKVQGSVVIRTENSYIYSGAGGARIYGSISEVFFKPTFHNELAVPALKVTGSGSLVIELAPVTYETGTGGARVYGTAAVKDERTYYVLGSGSVRVYGTAGEVSTSPTFHTVEGVPLLKVAGSSSLTAFNPTFHTEQGTGGLRVNGSVTVRTEQVFYLYGTGGPRIVGTAAVTTFVPDISIDSGTGGLRVLGTGADVIYLAPVSNLTGTGGLRIDGTAEVRIEKVLYVTGSGGVKLSPSSSDVEFNPVLTSLSGSGGLKVTGTGTDVLSKAPVVNEYGSGGSKVTGSASAVVELVLYGTGGIREINSSTVVAFVPTFYNEQPINNKVKLTGSATVVATSPSIVQVSGTGTIKVQASTGSVFEVIKYSLAAVRLIGSTQLAIVNPITVTEHPATAGCRILGAANTNYFAPTWHLLAGSGTVKINGSHSLVFVGTTYESGSGNVKILGSHTYNEYLAPVLYLTGSGGLKVNGTHYVEVFEAPVSKLEGTGGCKVSSEATHKFIDVSVEYAYPDLLVRGAAINSKFAPSYYTINGTGGAKVNKALSATEKFVYTTFINGTGGAKVNKALSATHSLFNPSWYIEASTCPIKISGTVGDGFLGTVYESGTGGLKVKGPATEIAFNPTFHIISGVPLLKVKGTYSLIFVEVVLERGTGGVKVSKSLSATVITEQGIELGTGGLKVRGSGSETFTSSNVSLVGSGTVKINKSLTAAHSLYVSTFRYTSTCAIKIRSATVLTIYQAAISNSSSGGIKISGYALDGTINTFVEPQPGARLHIRVSGTVPNIPNSVTHPNWFIENLVGRLKVRGSAIYAEDRIKFTGTGGLRLTSGSQDLKVPGPPPKIYVAAGNRIRVSGNCNYSLPLEWTEVGSGITVQSIKIEPTSTKNGGPSLTWSHAAIARIRVRATVAEVWSPYPPPPTIYVEYGQNNYYGYEWYSRIKVRGSHSVITNPIVERANGYVRVNRYNTYAYDIFKPAINTDYGTGGLRVCSRTSGGYNELWAGVSFNPIVEVSDGEETGIRLWRFSTAFFKVPNIFKFKSIADLHIIGQSPIEVYIQPNKEVTLPKSLTNIQISGTAKLVSVVPDITTIVGTNAGVFINGTSKVGFGDPSIFDIAGGDARIRVRHACVVVTSRGGGSGGGGGGNGGIHRARVRVRGSAKVSTVNVSAGYWKWDGKKWVWVGPVENTFYEDGTGGPVVGRYDSARVEKAEKILIISGYGGFTILGYGRTKMSHPNRYDEISIMDDPSRTGIHLSSVSGVQFLPG